MGAERLAITDGTNRIDLLSESSGFRLDKWNAKRLGKKGKGSYYDNPYSMGRTLAARVFDNILDVFDLRVIGDRQDILIEQTQELGRLLEKGIAYWTNTPVSGAAFGPVWIEAQAACETNTRYAIVKDYSYEKDGEPFAAPFVGVSPIALDGITLGIEHGPWLSLAPGSGTCLYLAAQTNYKWPGHLVFAGSTDNIFCGSDASIDNLHNANLTVEAWIKLRTTGGPAVQRLLCKPGTGNRGWEFTYSSTLGLRGIVNAATAAADSRSGLDEPLLDGNWHHVAMTYANAGDRKIYLFIDGVQVSYAGAQTAANGLIVSDAADSLIVGNNSLSATNFYGSMGWARISKSIRYTVNFTPQARCIPPAIDANTAGQWIQEGTGTTIYNQTGNALVDGVASGATWAFDCDHIYGRARTCAEDELFLANKNGGANITHIFVDDGGVFSANKIGAALPWALLPAVPAANDAVYFGVVIDGPFTNLIFDLSVAGANYTGVWEVYVGGAWAAFTPTDKTTALKVTGVHSVTWLENKGWQTTTINGVLGYWVRMRVSAIGAGPTAPTQQNREIYSATTAYLEVTAADIGGDISALLRVLITNVCHSSVGGSDGENLEVSNVLVGTRSLARGLIYSPFLNATNKQLPAGLTVTGTAVTTFQAMSALPAGVPGSPSGVLAAYTPGGVLAITKQLLYSMTPALMQEYVGRYRAFLRYYQSAINTGMQAAVSVVCGGDLIYATETVDLAISAGAPNIADLGLVDIIPPVGAADGYTAFQVQVRLGCTNGAAGTLYLYDLILFPADELSAQFLGSGELLIENRTLDIDSISYPRLPVRPMLRETSTDYVVSLWNRIQTQPVQLQANAAQRIWCLQWNGVIGSAAFSNLEILSSAYAQQVQRYFSARGDR